MQNQIIVFKFRDEILLSRSNELDQNHLKVPDSYYDAARKWHKKIFDFESQNQLNYKAINPMGLFLFGYKNIDDSDLSSICQSLKGQLERFLAFIGAINIEKRFLFEYNAIDSFNDFEHNIDNNPDSLAHIQDEQPISNGINDIPNFYNYFIISCDGSVQENDVKNLINQFESFLPHKNDYTHHLLDFAYLKGEEIEAEDEPLNSTSMNQAYFSDMQINITDDFDKGKNVNISIVEINRWKLCHPELNHLIPTASLIFPTVTSVDDYIQSDISHHGNGVLGILASTQLGESDQCYGITPLATFQLSSCTQTDTLDMNRSSILTVENAIWEAINKSDAGDIVLIEFENQGNSPIEFQPAIYQLFRYASSKNIIIIEPSGNGNYDIDNLSNWGNVKIINSRINLPSDVPPNEVWGSYSELVANTNGHTSINLDKTTFRQYLLHHPSGAILVGAAHKESIGGSFTRTHNWGKRVRIYAQGGSIATTDTTNYQSFGHTSGAAAIIAGVVASLQGKIKASHNKYFNAKQIENVLYVTASISVSDPGGVGKIPNYGTALSKLNSLALNSA